MSELRGCSGLSHAFVYRGKLPLGSKCECGAYESGPTGPTGMTAQPVSHAVPIPLSPEPPRDRVVEAVHQSGSVISRWAWDDEVESWSMFGYKGTAHWSQLVSGAIAVGFSLRHVAADSGERS